MLTLSRTLHSAKARLFSSANGALFDKLMIVNRGEIAVRVIKTCKKLGIPTVSVFSDADRYAPHVEMADEAYHIGPAPSSESYLNMDRLLEVAIQSGSRAIHPGYGFLSESSVFARKLQEHSLANPNQSVTFVGPPPSAMDIMSSKSAAKALMIDAGVPVAPGYHGEDQTYERLHEEANKIGYPLMIKAVLGGGGKGMRVVRKEKDFKEALEQCQREGLKSFGDARVLLERFIVAPRHIEYQVFGDQHGNVVHLFERDCSVQRRHQKVIEEAPAPFLSDEVREKMGLAAVNCAKAVGYEGAGTVEFLVEGWKDGEPENSQDPFFAFCEMNTRLQVEHPVSEMITGLDFVEWQIRVAAGQPLPLSQDQITKRGHAVEARIYAENPYNDFLPSTGRLNFLRTPEPSATLRIESGVREGDEISIFYDPMIAKVVVHSPEGGRDEAMKLLDSTLSNFHVSGVKNNIQFVKSVLQLPSLKNSTIPLDTSFLDELKAATNEGHASIDLFSEPPSSPRTVALGLMFRHLNLTALLQQQEYASKNNKHRVASHMWGQGAHHWRQVSGEKTFTFGREGEEEGEEESKSDVPSTYTFSSSPSKGVVITLPSEESFSFGFPVLRQVSDSAYSFEVEAKDGDHYSLVKGVVYIEGGAEGSMREESKVHLWVNGDEQQQEEADLRFAPLVSSSTQGHGGDASGSLVAPMPGKVIKVLKQEGETVAEVGEGILVVEAMKMEHVVRAKTKGVVSSVFFKEGDLVSDADVLAVITPEEEGA